MLTTWPIRKKLLFGIAMLWLIVAILAISSFRGVYGYRNIARTMSVRATELPYADELMRSVSNLRYTISRLQPEPHFPIASTFDPVDVREDFRDDFLLVQDALRNYSDQLSVGVADDPRLGDHREEQETIRDIERTLEQIAEMNNDADWVLDSIKVLLLREQLNELHRLSGELPSHLHRRMHEFAGMIKTEYRALIILTWVTSILAIAMLVVLLRFFYSSIFYPLRILIHGSRRVAGGEFDHRIQLSTEDEVAELANAMNNMTTRFQEIRDDLDQKVQVRTKEVVRSEKLASVGFLAAGVAHEINNPLASIAWAAEAMESRILEMFPDEENNGEEAAPESEMGVLKYYLRCIQDEAFRCKGITGSLLDYSRMGDSEKQDTELRELVAGVVGMIQHLGKYREKTITLSDGAPVMATVNSQEIKQVVMNLVTNALDSLSAGGTVSVDVVASGAGAELRVVDNGCGMDEHVVQHLFEPFFTHGKDGRGTGLGLSITHQIVTDHGGRIVASSEGQGRGSEFRVFLPKVKHEQEDQKNAA